MLLEAYFYSWLTQRGESENMKEWNCRLTGAFLRATSKLQEPTWAVHACLQCELSRISFSQAFFPHYWGQSHRLTCYFKDVRAHLLQASSLYVRWCFMLSAEEVTDSKWKYARVKLKEFLPFCLLLTCKCFFCQEQMIVLTTVTVKLGSSGVPITISQFLFGNDTSYNGSRWSQEPQIALK